MSNSDLPREPRRTGSSGRLGDGEHAGRITAVKEIVIPREALPTGAIDRLEPAPPEPVAAAQVAATEPTAGTEPIAAAVVATEPMAATEQIAPAAVAATAPIAVPGPAAAEPVPEIHTDKIAHKRGMPPLAAPYVRTARRSHGWVIASVAVTVLSIGAAATAVAWARAKVEQARGDVDGARAAQRGYAEWAAGVMAGAIANPPAAPPQAAAVIAQPSECAPPVTELTIESRPAGATVSLDGRELGVTPLVTTVNRYEAGSLTIRAPGRSTERRKILPTEPTQTLKVTLDPR